MTIPDAPPAAPVSAPATGRAAHHPGEQRPHRHPALVLLLGSLGVFMVFLDTTIVNIGFETVSHSFHTTVDRLSWVLNAYSLVFAATLIPAGRVADRYGRKRVFMIGLAGFAAMSALCGLAPNPDILISGRALQAAFAALVVPTSLALVLPEFPGNRRHVAVGTWGAMSAAAAATGPTIGALLIQYTSWRWIFLVNVPIGALVIIAGLRTLHETREPRTSGLPDPLGILLVAAVPALLSYSIMEGPPRGWSNPEIIAGFVLCAALLPLLLWRTVHSANPVLDLHLFRNRQFRLVNASTLLFATAFYGMLLSNVVFLQTIWHYSVLRAALASAPGPLLVAVLARFTSKLSARIGHRPVLISGAVVWAFAVAGYAVWTGETPHWVEYWLPFNLLSGLGISLTLPVQSAASVSTLPPARYALGSAINSSFRQIGAVLGISLFVALVGAHAPGKVLDGFKHGWWLFAGLSLASGAIQLLPRLYRTWGNTEAPSTAGIAPQTAAGSATSGATTAMGSLSAPESVPG